MRWDVISSGNVVIKQCIPKGGSKIKETYDLKLTDWNPGDISDYITISWESNGKIVNPDEIIPEKITFTASSSKEFIDYLVVNKKTVFDVDGYLIVSD